MKDCKQSLEMIRRHFDGDLNQFQSGLMFKHLEQCNFCRSEYETMQQALELFDQASTAEMQTVDKVFDPDAFMNDLNVRLSQPDWKERISNWLLPLTSIGQFLNHYLIKNKLVLSAGIILLVFFNAYYLFFYDPQPAVINQQVIHQDASVIYRPTEHSLTEDNKIWLNTKVDDDEEEMKKEKSKKRAKDVVRINL